MQCSPLCRTLKETTWENSTEENFQISIFINNNLQRGGEQFSKWQVAWKARYCYSLSLIVFILFCTKKHHEILISKITLSQNNIHDIKIICNPRERERKEETKQLIKMYKIEKQTKAKELKLSDFIVRVFMLQSSINSFFYVAVMKIKTNLPENKHGGFFLFINSCFMLSACITLLFIYALNLSLSCETKGVKSYYFGSKKYFASDQPPTNLLTASCL